MNKLLIFIFIFVLFLAADSSASAIFYDGFESGNLNGWATTNLPSSFPWTVSSTNPYRGTKHAQSQPRFTTEPASVLERAISTSGYSTVTFKYRRRLVGLDSPDEFKVKWFDGATWTVLEQTGISSVNNGNYVSKSFTLPASANNNSNFKVRFECTAGASNEYCRLDEVNISGNIIPGPDLTPPSLIVNSPVNGSAGSSTPNLNVTVIDYSVDAVWISVDGGQNITYAHRNGTIDFGYLNLIFADDFGNYATGSDGSPTWTNPSWFGKATVENGAYKLYNETALDDALSYITNFNAYNYGGSVKVKVPAGYYGGAYLTPRFGDVNYKYEIALDYDWSSININKVVGGVWSSLGALWTGDLPVPVYVAKDQWHSLGFKVQDTTISAYVDGQLALSAVDSDLNNTGFAMIAFDDTNQHLAYFDDVEIHQGLSQGQHTLIVYVNDTSGNLNYTSVNFFVN